MNRSLLPDELVSFDSDAYHSAGAQLWRGAGPGGHRMCSLTIECVLTALDLNFGAALDRVVTAAKTIANARHASIFFLEKTGVAPGGLQSNTIHSYGLRLKGRGTQDKVFPCEGLYDDVTYVYDDVFSYYRMCSLARCFHARDWRGFVQRRICRFSATARTMTRGLIRI